MDWLLRNWGGGDKRSDIKIIKFDKILLKLRSNLEVLLLIFFSKFEALFGLLTMLLNAYCLLVIICNKNMHNFQFFLVVMQTSIDFFFSGVLTILKALSELGNNWAEYCRISTHYFFEDDGSLWWDMWYLLYTNNYDYYHYKE